MVVFIVPFCCGLCKLCVELSRKRTTEIGGFVLLAHYESYKIPWKKCFYNLYEDKLSIIMVF